VNSRADQDRNVGGQQNSGEQFAVSLTARRLLWLMAWVRRRWWLSLLLLVGVLAALLGAGEYVSSRPSFCGRCHNMKPYYATWKAGVHSKEGVTCVQCHYAPGEQHSLHAKLKGLSQVAMYAAGAFGGSRLRGHVNSDSCLASGCHDLVDFENEGFAFPRRGPEESGGGGDGGTPAGTKADGTHSLKPFVHRSHLQFLSTGHKLECATCHERRPGDAHMAVYPGACFLCHFKHEKFNAGRAACLTCHELPTKPIQTSGTEPITHKTLEARGVGCASCHSQDIQGEGTVHEERCSACHDKPSLLAEWEYVKPHKCATKSDTDVCAACQKALKSRLYLHKTHVPTQHANCTDCHLGIKHGKLKDDLPTNLRDCRACHIEAHETTIALLEGKMGAEADAKIYKPFEMWSSHTTCTGCHIEAKTTAKHSGVMGAGERACKTCHGESHNVFQSWKGLVGDGAEEAAELQKEAHGALSESSDGLSDDSRGSLEATLRKADDLLIYLRKAGAMHNPKTSGELLNQAMDIYEDTIDEIDRKKNEKDK